MTSDDVPARALVGAAIAALLLAASARAAPQPSDAPRDFHAGVNFRTDFGTHPLRLDGGARFGRLDTILVLDPMFFTDGQHDIDALVDWRFSPRGWSLQGGWRTTAVALAGGHQFQQKSVFGIAGRLPELWDGRVRAQAGLECTILWIKHGADLPTDWISVDSGLGFTDLINSGRRVADLINFGLFLRFEHATAF